MSTGEYIRRGSMAIANHVSRFPRPPHNADEKTLVILGGGRESVGPHHEHNVADDSTINPVVSQTLRKFLPHLYPDDFKDHAPEMEWVSRVFWCLYHLSHRTIVHRLG